MYQQFVLIKASFSPQTSVTKECINNSDDTHELKIQHHRNHNEVENCVTRLTRSCCQRKIRVTKHLSTQLNSQF